MNLSKKSMLIFVYNDNEMMCIICYNNF